MSKKQSTLYYFYSVGCTFCNKVEPIVDKLNSDGYEIIKVDSTESENKLFKHEIESKYNLRCGTPLLVDSETGNAVCGWRDEETIKKWADGEKIPEPPKPKGKAPQLPKDFSNEKEVSIFKKAYVKWKNKNKHIPGLQSADEIINKFKRNQEHQKQQRESVNGRLTVIETKLDKLMNHLGVK
tara:strand:- start:8 stop:553 length:546 start_codon:yes stop_codon:yes gene_type:complete